MGFRAGVAARESYDKPDAASEKKRDDEALPLFAALLLAAGCALACCSLGLVVGIRRSHRMNGFLGSPRLRRIVEGESIQLHRLDSVSIGCLTQTACV